jgi:DNA mismatch endonuclease (patch repair protein)
MKKAGHRSWGAYGAKVKGTHKGDIMSKESRSRLMSRIRTSKTGPENTLCRMLRRAGIGFSRNDKRLPGTPDVVFHDAKIVVFVDGDFWHGWRFPLWRHKLTIGWQSKISANRRRDQRNFRILRRAGWKVIRVWEHQIERSAEECAQMIVRSHGRRLPLHSD